MANSLLQRNRNRTPRTRLALLVGFAISAAWNAGGPSAVGADEKLTSRVDAIVRKAGITADGPGVAVLVVHKGKVAVKKGYGLANLKQRTPITPETTFELASLSKPFCATAILLLHDRGQLGLSDDVRKFVPELALYHRQHPIGIVHLLQHTSGLPDYTGLDDPEPGENGYVNNGLYAKYLAAHKDDFQPTLLPGKKYEYSNTNFLLLALVVERISQKSFGKFLHDEVLVPSGMRQTWVYESPESVLKHPTLGWVNAVGYESRKKDKKTYRPTWGSPPFRTETMLVVGDGSVWTSLDDMIHWDAAVRRRQILKPATWKLALTPSRTADGEVNDYGLGWGLELDDNHQLTGFGHDGSWGSFETCYSHSLEDDLTIVLLSNRSTIDTDELRDAIDALFNEE